MIGFFPAKTAEQYRDALLRLVPEGAAWDKSPGSGIYQACWAFGSAMSTLHGRLLDAVETEMDPRTAGETIDAWEAAWGLPDACAPAPTSLSARQAALHAKILDNGGMTIGDIVAVAAALGYVVTVTPVYQVYWRWNVSVWGDRLWSWASADKILVEADESGALVDRDVYECAISRIIAHASWEFTYLP